LLLLGKEAKKSIGVREEGGGVGFRRKLFATPIANYGKKNIPIAETFQAG